jgi:hypothetical protein
MDRVEHTSAGDHVEFAMGATGIDAGADPSLISKADRLRYVGDLVDELYLMLQERLIVKTTPGTDPASLSIISREGLVQQSR